MAEWTVTRRDAVKTVALGAGLAAAPAAAVARGGYRDASLPVAARVDDLLARMTLEEKVQQIVGIANGRDKIEDSRGQFDRAAARRNLPSGVGFICSPSFNHVIKPGKEATFSASECAAYMNALQRWAVEDTRLGIPLIAHEEALHGLRGRDATSFPAAIGLASSWDPDLVTRVFAATAGEVRARGSQMVLTPVLDVARELRWGRVEETYGEDTHLVSEIGVAAIRGFQGASTPDRLAPGHVYATVKHFAGHGVPENGSNTGPLMMGERTLREQLLPSYQAGIQRGRAPSVMVTYHEIDGIPCAANPWLLQTVLRREWGFAGMVVSDYNAIRELATIHGVATDLPAAGVMALLAGTDVELPDAQCFVTLPALVRAGRVPVARIDEAVRRVLTVKFAIGLFENPYVDVAAAEAATGGAAARTLAREAAGRSMVLLKNDGGTLPLAAERVGRLAVIGHSAVDTPIGGYSEPPRHVVSVLEALQAEAAGGRFTVDYAEGARATMTRDWYNDDVEVPSAAAAAVARAEAVALARRSDRVLLVVGDTEETAREAWTVEHKGDRASLDLFGHQQELADALLALGKPVIVLLLNGRPPAIPAIAERAAAIIEGWYLGEETGNAVADVLFGRVNPGGKLPISIARSVGQLPVYYARKPSARRGYLDSSTEPLYAFGHGLSYTRFDLSTPRVPATARAGHDVAVEVNVTNVGDRAGDEVVQVYLHQEVASITRPVRLLKAFQRITLAPGERRTVRLTIRAEAFTLWNRDMRQVVEPGRFRIEAGPNLAELKAATIDITA